MATKYECARCKVPVGVWFYGWKHQNGGGGKKSCGKTPVPVERILPQAKSDDKYKR